MKAPKILFNLLVILLFFSCASVKHTETPAKTPSLMDFHDQGLYYGFIVNNSSHFTEVAIWSMEKNSMVRPKIVLPPPGLSSRENIKIPAHWNSTEYAYRPPNVISLWLKLDSYKVLIRKRNDLVDEEAPGPWKAFMVVLDKEYVERTQGPFTLDIEDD
ncbi:MAG: hypothetical protein JSU83_04440 [Deltaproteobacteria bacterium]|nr:MAG: hypothetical protein JSU83_04440 [Deltaproteobacteria bacterium]